MIWRRTLAVAVLVMTFSGCGFFSRPKNTFYSLETLPGTVTDAGGMPIGVDGIELPPGLDRRGIMVRGEDNKFEIRQTHQWTSPLEEMVIHTLAFDLANRLPDGRVILPGQAKPVAMRGLYVTFAELAPGPDQMFVLDARWTLTQTGAPERAGHERITVNLPSLESPAVVEGMSQALAQLADRIVAAL